MSAAPNLPVKSRISRTRLSVVAGIFVAVIGSTAAFYVWRANSVAEVSSDQTSEAKACCVAPPVSRLKALTSAPPPKTAPEHAAPHD